MASGVSRVLRTRRLTLRPFRLADARPHAGLLADPETARYLGRSAPPALWSVAARIPLLRLEVAAGRALRFALELREPGAARFAGFVAVHRLREPTAWLSYGVVPALRRQGLASEALEALVAALEQAALPRPRRLAAHTHPDNRASAALLARLGFTPLGSAETPAGTRLEHRLELAPPAS